jgi:tetratricopeptide (TPR) repeat protein
MRRLWLGKAYLKLQRWDDAIRELQLAVQAEPANCLFHLWLGRAYGHKASHVAFFRAMGLAGNVRDQFERARSLCPEKLEVRFDLLDFYFQAPGIVGAMQATEAIKLLAGIGEPLVDDVTHTHESVLVIASGGVWRSQRHTLPQRNRVATVSASSSSS